MQCHGHSDLFLKSEEIILIFIQYVNLWHYLRTSKLIRGNILLINYFATKRNYFYYLMKINKWEFLILKKKKGINERNRSINGKIWPLPKIHVKIYLLAVLYSDDLPLSKNLIEALWRRGSVMIFLVIALSIWKMFIVLYSKVNEELVFLFEYISDEIINWLST